MPRLSGYQLRSLRLHAALCLLVQTDACCHRAESSGGGFEQFQACSFVLLFYTLRPVQVPPSLRDPGFHLVIKSWNQCKCWSSDWIELCFFLLTMQIAASEEDQLGVAAINCDDISTWAFEVRYPRMVLLGHAQASESWEVLMVAFPAGFAL